MVKMHSDTQVTYHATRAVNVTGLNMTPYNIHTPFIWCRK